MTPVQQLWKKKNNQHYAVNRYVRTPSRTHGQPAHPTQTNTNTEERACKCECCECVLPVALSPLPFSPFSSWRLQGACPLCLNLRVWVLCVWVYVAVSLAREQWKVVTTMVVGLHLQLFWVKNSRRFPQQNAVLLNDKAWKNGL